MEKTIESILPIVLLFVSSGLFFLWDILMQREYRNIKTKRFFCVLLLVCFVYVFVKITLIGREISLQRRVWIMPFYSYYKFLSGWQVFLFKQNIQNTLLFMPLGYFGSILLGQRMSWKCRTNIVGSGMFLSLLVEIIQYTKKTGLLEMDDIINNTIGTFLGCLLYETICCMRIVKTQKHRYSIELINRPRFIKNMKWMGIIITIYLLLILVGCANHLYHVYVLWR